MSSPPRCPAGPIEIALVVGGRWHDIDFARRELLTLLGDHDGVRCSVHDDFSDISATRRPEAVVAYTCDVRPDARASAELREIVRDGGRLLALHATNAAIDPPDPAGPRVFRTPDAMPAFSALLGSRFLSHPKIAPSLVEVTDPAHPLVEGVPSFVTTDEIYVSSLDPGLTVLLETEFCGPCPGFEHDRVDEPSRLPVLYTRTEGRGALTYFTLGHCRGRFDLQDQGVQDLGVLDRAAWSSPQYREVLRRTIGWAVHGDAWPHCPAGYGPGS